MEFANEQTIAWKTGTSFGARDAWSIGLSGNYIVGVWVGNADGEGRPSLTGIGMASPIMFDLFNLLPKQAWLDEPFCAKSIKVCQQSGWKATPDCPTSRELKDPSVIGFSPSCSFHKRIALDSSGSHRVTSACYPSFSMKHEVMFVLPPIQEWYYKKKHADFKKLPPFYNSCLSPGYEKNIGLLYPRKGIRVFIPKELSGKKSKVVFEATHRLEQQRIFWHLNNEFVGETTTIHQLELSPKAGDYLLTLVDEKGEQLQCSFTVVEK